MGKELALVREGGPGSLPAVKRRTKKLVSKDLAKKEELSKREHVWVYKSRYSLVASFLSLCGFIPAEVIYNSTASDIGFAGGIAAAAVAMVISIIDVSYKMSDDCRRDSVDLDVNQRQLHVFQERSRINAPHASDRKGRYADAKYAQYSVWIDYSKDQIVLSILKHRPTDKGFRAEIWGKAVPVAASGDGNYRSAAEKIQLAQKSFNRNDYKDQDDDRGIDRLWEGVLDTQSDFELMARAQEERDYEESIAGLDLKQLALKARR